MRGCLVNRTHYVAVCMYLLEISIQVSFTYQN